jgi:translation initiation factor IF-2
MRSATWKTYFKNIRAILRTIDQCAKDVKEIQTAMLVRVFVFNVQYFLIKKISQLIIEEERQRKLTEGIKESQEVLGAVVLRMSPEIIMGISNETTISRSRAPSLRIRRPHLPRIV